MQKILNKKCLIAWLKSAGAITILSIGVLGKGDELFTNINKPYHLAVALAEEMVSWDDGPYFVDYEEGKDGDKENIPYSSYVFAVAVKMGKNNHPGEYLGRLDALLSGLSNYEYLVKIDKFIFPITATFLVLLPQDPNELKVLDEIVKRNSVTYAFPDGTGTLNQSNLKMGEGLKA